MRTGFIAGIAFVIGLTIGAFLIGPAMYRQPQKTAAVVEPPPAAQSTQAQLVNPFDAARNEGDAAMDGGNCTTAIAAYERALSMKFDADAATDRGVCLRQVGRREEALAAFEFVTLKEPSHWKARYNLTAMLIEANRIEDARKSLLLLRTLNADAEAVKTLEKALTAAN